MTENELLSIIKDILKREELEDTTLTLFSLLDMLEYATLEYRMLQKEHKSGLSKSSVMPKNIDYVLGNEIGINYNFSKGALSVIGSCNLDYLNNTSVGLNTNEIKTFMSSNKAIIANAMGILRRTTQTFNLENTSYTNLTDLIQIIDYEGLTIYINPLDAPKIFYLGNDITDDESVKKHKEELFQSIPISKQSLIPQFEKLIYGEDREY